MVCLWYYRFLKLNFFLNLKGIIFNAFVAI